MATEQRQASSNGDPLEKDFSRNGTVNRGGYQNEHGTDHDHLDDINMGYDSALKRIRTAGSISISPDLFEKLYLSPQNAVKGDLRKTFANPTPLCIVGFLLALTPLSCDLMGWRGAGGSGAAGIGTYYFFGGMLMMIGSVLEFFLGNTFPFVVFGSFSAFWLSFGATLQPTYYAYGLYAAAGADPSTGLETVGFNASWAFFLVFMGLLCLIYLVCSLRTNVAFVIIFFTLVIAFSLLAGAYWQTANSIGNKDAAAAALAHRLQIAGGACLFVTALTGWWIFAAIMLAALDFPFAIPVGDLSKWITTAAERRKAKANADMV